MHHPWFLADVPGWNNEGVGPDGEFSDDRRYLETVIARREVLTGVSSTVSILLHNSTERLYFQSAFHYKGIHERFVQGHCSRTKENLEAAKLELESVIACHPELSTAARRLERELADMIART